MAGCSTSRSCSFHLWYRYPLCPGKCPLHHRENLWQSYGRWILLGAGAVVLLVGGGILIFAGGGKKKKTASSKKNDKAEEKTEEKTEETETEPHEDTK